MEENIIRIISFSGERDKWCMWSGKFLARSGHLGYYIILRVTAKILEDNAEENTKENDTLNQLNKN